MMADKVFGTRHATRAGDLTIGPARYADRKVTGIDRTPRKTSDSLLGTSLVALLTLCVTRALDGSINGGTLHLSQALRPTLDQITRNGSRG